MVCKTCLQIGSIVRSIINICCFIHLDTFVCDSICEKSQTLPPRYRHPGSYSFADLLTDAQIEKSKNRVVDNKGPSVVKGRAPSQLESAAGPFSHHVVVPCGSYYILASSGRVFRPQPQCLTLLQRRDSLYLLLSMSQVPSTQLSVSLVIHSCVISAEQHEGCGDVLVL